MILISEITEKIYILKLNAATNFYFHDPYLLKAPKQDMSLLPAGAIQNELNHLTLARCQS